MNGNRGTRRFALPWVTAALLLCAVASLAAGAQKPRPRPQPHTPIRDPEHVFRRYVKSWRDIKYENIVLQQRDYSCGAAALATMIRYHWGDPITETDILKTVINLLTIDEMKERIKNGLSLTDLRRVAVKLGYQATIGKLEFEKLKESKIPLIVGIVVGEYDHFVVFRGADGGWVYLADPARGNIRIPEHEFISQWQKNAVLVVVKPNVEPTRISPLTLDPHEILLGDVNRIFVRNRVTGRIRILPSAPTW